MENATINAVANVGVPPGMEYATVCDEITK
jgi:hypothetical protein